MLRRVPILWRWVATVCLACAWAVAAAAAPMLSWFDNNGRPTAQAGEALGLLADAATHGLDPRDYGGPALAEAVARAAPGGASPEALQRLDQGLTQAMVRYFSDLYRGRVDPRQIHQDYNAAWPGDFDAAVALQGALSAGRLTAAARELWPRLPLYQRLREALAHYRTLDDAGWQSPLPPLPGGMRAGKLEPGGSWDGLAGLIDRLVVLGDVAERPAADARYDGPLVAAVQSFQARHGLAADGVVGRSTWAALQVPPSRRVRQIELALERLRWTPLLQGPRVVVINLPEFVLRAYEVQAGSITVRTQMKVIVGKVLDTRTPMFDEDMRFIEFAPYWNVPPSIARGELVPRLRRDPAYWQHEGFEFVTGAGQVQVGLSADALDAVMAGRARIRQRPGPKNALGDIKFVFPNSTNIYLHHTPSVGLFERDRRDFSHGCIRVEKPVELATFVLQDMPEWTEARIRAAMASGISHTLRLNEPVPVLITYGTSLVKEGRIHFFDDIYGHDRLLDAALRARSDVRQQREAIRP